MAVVLGSSRRLLAEPSRIGEVEERRLHLAAACPSMFVYCLKLGIGHRSFDVLSYACRAGPAGR